MIFELLVSFGMAFGLIFVPTLFVLALYEISNWRDGVPKRHLIRQAREYGIDYIEGEDLDKLRARVVKARDEGLK